MAPVETSLFERNQPRLGRWLGAGLVATALLASAGPAGASPTFPAAVQEALGLACAPPCLLCHTSPAGGSETVGQPFYLSLGCFGTVNESTMATVLKSLETLPCRGTNATTMCMPTGTAPCDTDADGVADVAELKLDTNPNPGGSDLACPHYGCGAHIAPVSPRRPIDGTAALAALGTLVVLASRWRRR